MIKEKKLPYNILNHIDDLANILKENHSVIALYLFGSAVSSKITPLSDLDFAVLLDKSLNKKRIQFDEELKLREVISGVLKTEEFDLVILNSAPKSFVKNIINNSKLLFCSEKNQLLDFINISGIEYLDFVYFRNEFMKTFKQIKGIS